MLSFVLLVALAFPTALPRNGVAPAPALPSQGKAKADAPADARPEDEPFLARGLVKDPFGNWVTPEERARFDAGWTRQDLVWIAPDDAARVDQGLWRCGDEWLATAEADRYHAELNRWWIVPSDHFVLMTTCPRSIVPRALEHLEHAWRDLARIYTVYPSEKPRVLLLRSARQYNEFSVGRRTRENPATDLRGMASVHGAYFADFWFDLSRVEEGIIEFNGVGVAFWDQEDETLGRSGPLFLRHAAGLSYAEAIDPSPNALESIASGAEAFERAFWDEKLLPRWFRYGAATYVERYYVDPWAGADLEPTWTRTWSVDNLKNRGGLEKLDTVFELEIGPDDVETGERRLNETGLLVWFLLEGGCAPVDRQFVKVHEALAKWKDDEKNAKDVEKAFTALEKTLKKNEKAIKAFAKL